jgi:predicted nucleotidyltransferase component of viral defense system
MDISLVNKIKRLAIIALASDDELMETLVLKGGNAIELAYLPKKFGISRTSYDLDYSIETGDFNEDFKIIGKRIESALARTFLENDMNVIDFQFGPRPKTAREETAEFWGGYKSTFKVVDKQIAGQLKANLEELRRKAVPLRPNNSPTFELEFSKYEYVGQKQSIKVEGYTIYVYTREMIVFEKLRAICQQLPAYREILPSHSPRARARDFYDIELIMEQFQINPDTSENKELIAHIFAAKRVPLSFIRDIRQHVSLHVDDWQSVQDTVEQGEVLSPFEYYVDYVVKKFELLTFLEDNTGAIPVSTLDPSSHR